jgi:hypothetical protein
MYGFQGFDKLEEAIPNFDDVPSTTWWPLPLEIFLKRALVGKLNQNVIVLSVNVAAIEPYDTL